MPVTPKQVYETSDGQTFESEQEASDHELKLELAPMIEDYLEKHIVTQRLRRNQVADLILGFAVELLTPPTAQTKHRAPVDE